MQDDGHIRIGQQRPVFTREQKIALGLVLSFGFLAFILGGFYMWKHVASPFVVSYTGPRLLLGDAKTAADNAALKAVDTDGDGLNDYDELYVYKTSPYLADSDSDGVADKIEVDAGQDPNCAIGATCANAALNPNAVTPTTVDATALSGANGLQDPGTFSTADELAKALASFTPAEIRAMLVQSGAEQATVDAMTDEEVQVLFQKVVVDLQASGALDDAIAAAKASDASGAGTTTSTTTP